jgi:hypothetical protein
VEQLSVLCLRKASPRKILNEHAKGNSQHRPFPEEVENGSGFARRSLPNPKCPQGRARKNFWRLIAKHPDVAAQMKVSLLSVFEGMEV